MVEEKVPDSIALVTTFCLLAKMMRFWFSSARLRTASHGAIFRLLCSKFESSVRCVAPAAARVVTRGQRSEIPAFGLVAWVITFGWKSFSRQFYFMPNVAALL